MDIYLSLFFRFILNRFILTPFAIKIEHKSYGMSILYKIMLCNKELIILNNK